MNTIDKLAKSLDKYYIKLPALPKGIKDFLVSITPWLALIFGALTILQAIRNITLVPSLSSLSSMAYMAMPITQAYMISFVLSAIIMLIQGVLEVMAFSPLKAGKTKGWSLLYYTLILSVVGSVVWININGVIMAIIGGLIGYYFLYQIKSHYK